MKEGQARFYVWWPGIDTQIEEQVATCGKCQQGHIDNSVSTVAPLGVAQQTMVLNTRGLCQPHNGQNAIGVSGCVFKVG